MVYLAIDNDNLYIAADIIDDDQEYGEGDWWNQDALQMLIGLYDSRKGKHDSYQRGEEQDYQLIFKQGEMTREPSA